MDCFLVSQNLDAHVFAWLKKKYENKIVIRSLTSDVIDLTLDSMIFVTIAFYGVAPIIPLIIGQIISKNVICFLDTPWFVWYKKMLTREEVSLIPKRFSKRLRTKLRM